MTYARKSLVSLDDTPYYDICAELGHPSIRIVQFLLSRSMGVPFRDLAITAPRRRSVSTSSFATDSAANTAS